MKESKLTVITVVFNAERSIEKTIRSVISQKECNLEYIVIDGGSVDGTEKIIQRYSNYISHWCNEKDKGIYDAMNKGIEKSTGDWIYFLNAGDEFYNSNVVKNIKCILEKKDISIILGNVKYNTGRIFLSDINYKIFFKNTIHHQGAIYSKEIFKKFRYDISYKILGDYDLNLYMRKNFKKPIKVNLFFAICEDYGISQKIIWSKYLEEIYIRKKYYGKLFTYIGGIISCAKFLFKKVKIGILSNGRF